MGSIESLIADGTDTAPLLLLVTVTDELDEVVVLGPPEKCMFRG